jgi:hypothetical protein
MYFLQFDNNYKKSLFSYYRDYNSGYAQILSLSTGGDP